jgi:hypothetical protein
MRNTDKSRKQRDRFERLTLRHNREHTSRRQEPAPDNGRDPQDEE